MKPAPCPSCGLSPENHATWNPREGFWTCGGESPAKVANAKWLDGTPYRYTPPTTEAEPTRPNMGRTMFTGERFPPEVEVVHGAYNHPSHRFVPSHIGTSDQDVCLNGCGAIYNFAEQPCSKAIHCESCSRVPGHVAPDHSCPLPALEPGRVSEAVCQECKSHSGEPHEQWCLTRRA